MDSLDTKQSKQRASIKWLLSKAFNNRVPENLHEPFYRDHEDQEHLKPPIVGGLANAELYCLALANIYSDPNYHNLNHWNILQTLNRKGIQVDDPPDCSLTETVLIQTNPLRLSAHMCVVEAVMTLYGREVVTWERVNAAVHRFGTPLTSSVVSNKATTEDGLIEWINSATTALNKGQSDDECLPQVQKVSNLQELCDGTALAALISFYCPDALPRNRIRVGRVSSLQDCLHNIMLVYDFCQKHLPHNVFHMMPEDVTYMRGSMRQNLVVMLADLFNMLEVHPVKSVKYPSFECGVSNQHGVVARRQLPPPPPNPIPDLCPDRDQPIFHTGSSSRMGGRATPEGAGSAGSVNEFPVHRGRSVTTLSSVTAVHESNVHMTAAGRPSSRDEQRSFSGRRSRRSSITDDSQLTVENFGGSQDHLNFIGKNPEKELATLTSMRKISAPAGPIVQNTPVRSSLQDARGSIQFFYDDMQFQTSQDEKKPLDRQYSQPQNNNEPEKSVQYHPIRRQHSSDTIMLSRNYNRNNERGGSDNGFYLNNSNVDATDGDLGRNMATFANMNRLRNNGDQTGINLVYSQLSSEQDDVQPRKKTSFSTLPNTTTWQQQSIQHEMMHHNGGNSENQEDLSNNAMAAELNTIRLKLEEKRRRIQLEKQKMEASLNRQRQQMGQQAFLQAVAKNKGEGTSPTHTARTTHNDEQEISVDVKTIENKWLDCNDYGSRRTPDIDGMGYEEYQQSIAQMNTSLQDLQSDIARLASQQNQLQGNQLCTQNKHQQQQNYNSNNSYEQPQRRQSFQQSQQIFQQNQQNYHQSQPQFQQNQQPFQLNQQSYQQNQQNYQHNQQNFQQNQQNYQQNQQNYQQPQQAYHNDSFNHSKSNDISYDINDYSANQIHTNIPQLHNQYNSQHNVSVPPRLQNTSFGSTPHIPQHNNTYSGDNGQFFLHEGSPVRRTWAQRPHAEELRTWQTSTPQKLRESPQRLRRSPSPPSPPSPAHNAGVVNTPSVIDMEPQNISFIGDGIQHMNISSGTATYRLRGVGGSGSESGGDSGRGFYVSLDEGPPKRTKPPLKQRRAGVGTVTASPPSPSPVINQPSPSRTLTSHHVSTLSKSPQTAPAAIVIADTNPDPESVEEMERKKERIMMMSLQRRQRAEEARARAENAAAARRAKDQAAAELKAQRKEEQARRREAILQQYKMKKAVEEAEKEGKPIDRHEVIKGSSTSNVSGIGSARLRNRTVARASRPKTIHVDSDALQRSHTNLTAYGTSSMRRDYFRGSQDSLTDRASLYRDSPVEESRVMSPSCNSTSALGRRGSYKTSREYVNEVDNNSIRGRNKYSTYQNNFKTGRKSSSLMNLCDSGLGRATPPRRAASPGGRTLPSPCGPGSLPPVSHRRRIDDNASDISSTHSSIADYSGENNDKVGLKEIVPTGPRLYKQPATKSNRGIMLNAVEYCVFPGVVNREAKRRVLEEIARSESKHFLVLFRDAGCQFRALYSFCPETENVTKLYGTGPKNVNDRMFDKFFKYNSGSKCFSQIHTKHLTVTIDAFTIHNSLWQGKKVQLPSKKDMALVI